MLISSTKYAEAIQTPSPGPLWCHPDRGQNYMHPERSACSRAPCGAGPREGLRSHLLLRRTGQQEFPPPVGPESPAKRSSFQLLLFIAPILPPSGAPPHSSRDAKDGFLGLLPSLPGLHTELPHSPTHPNNSGTFPALQQPCSPLILSDPSGRWSMPSKSPP